MGGQLIKEGWCEQGGVGIDWESFEKSMDCVHPSCQCVGTRKHQSIRIDGFWCLIRVFPGDLSIVQGFCEV